MYAWGHNGQLKDNEIYGNGNAYTAEYWEYDARLIRRWNTDPITFADQSTYACFNNNPINDNDPLGLTPEGREERQARREARRLARKNPVGIDLDIVQITSERTKKAAIKVGVELVSGYIKLQTYSQSIGYTIQNSGEGVGIFLSALSNAVITNNILGVGRKDPSEFRGNVDLANSGQKVGDAISMYQGAVMINAGLTGEWLGVGLDLTGFGAFAGVPLGTISAAIAADGAIVITTAAYNFAKTNSRNEEAHDGGGNKNDPMKGGSKKQRDGDYLSKKGKDFERWFHREYKKGNEGERVRSNDEIDDAYKEWESLGKPKVK